MPGICVRAAAVGVTLSLLHACATSALAPGAEKVPLTQKAADFQNQAIGLSGNTVFITKQYLGAPVEGVVYRCAGRG
jgi:hypothetical protein